MWNLSEIEIEWLKLAISDNNKYRITVDNDCVYIDECIDEVADEWDSPFSFRYYGTDFIIQLLSYIGCQVQPA